MGNTSKQRQMLRITWLNLLLGLILMAVFIISTLGLSASLRHERENQSRLTLEHFSESFLAETTHLRDVLTLLKSNSNLNMLAASSSTAWNDMSNYALNAISLLSTTQQSLNNVNRLVFIAPHAERAFSSEGMLHLRYLPSAEWINQLLAPEEKPEDLASLSDGWHAFQSCAFYVQRSTNGSILLSVVKSSQLADINTFPKVNPDQHIIVLDHSGHYFSSSFNTARYSIEQGNTYAALSNGDICNILGIDYIVTRLDSESFSFLLLTDRHTPEHSYLSLNLSIAIVLAAALTLLALTLANTTYFGRIRRLVDPRGQENNDIERLRQIVQERAAYHRTQIEHFIALATSDAATDKDFAAISPTIAEEYDRYFILTLAVQSTTPLRSDLFVQLSQFLSDHFPCCGASSREGHMTFIAERVPGTEALSIILSQFFDSLEGNLCAWAGVSTSYSDPKSLRRAFAQAKKRMMTLPCRHEERFSYADTTLPTAFILPQSTVQNLLNALFNEDFESAHSLWEQLVYHSEPPCTLYGMQSLGNMLFGALKKQSNCFESVSAATVFYHPECLWAALLQQASLFHKAHNNAPEEDDTPSSTGSANAISAWIEIHYAEDISLESVADQFHITPVHLSRWFKKETGINFSVFLSTLRINHARDLLDADPSIKNADLAAHIGMASVLTFTRQFKAQTGMTPDQYRAAVRSTSLC